MMVSISVGTVVGDRRGKISCRTGAFVQDGAGRRFGLAARHVLDAVRGATIFEVATGESVGRKVPPPANARGIRPAYEAIGMFELEHAIAAGMRCGDAEVTGVAAADDCLEAPVFKIEPNWPPAPGRVTEVGGAARIVDPFSGAETLYGGLTVVRFEPGYPVTVRSGEAGALVIDGAGRAVGLVIAGSVERCLVAPLDGFLEARRFHLIRAAALSQPMTDEAALRSGTWARAELELLELGRRRMFEDLTSERGGASSVSEAPPPALLALLDR